MTASSRLTAVAALHLSEPSGVSRSLLPVLAALAQRADVVTVVPGPGRASEEHGAVGRVVAMGHEALVLPRTPRDAVATALQLRADVRRFRTLLRRERAGLAIIGTTTLPALVLAARLERVPTILFAAELHEGGGVLTAARRAVVRLNARLATVTVSCSHAVAAALPRGVASVVAYPTIDPEADAGGDAEALRARHGVAAGGPVLAMLGNITYGRGQDVAIRALHDLRRDHPGAQLLIAGEPHPRPKDHAYASELTRLVSELGLDGAVHFCGFDL
ncbi:MAG TPA: glycosyltransferase, partial [Solirubrobacteraceae bacterium]